MILANISVLIVEDEPLIALQLEEVALELGAAQAILARTNEASGVLDAAGHVLGAAIVAARTADELGTALLGALDRRRIPFVMTTTDAIVEIPTGISVAYRVVAKPYSNEDISAALRALLDREAPPLG